MYYELFVVHKKIQEMFIIELIVKISVCCYLLVSLIERVYCIVRLHLDFRLEVVSIGVRHDY